MSSLQISLVVKRDDVVLFEKDVCSPQDVVAALSLFGSAGTTVVIDFKSVKVS